MPSSSNGELNTIMEETMGVAALIRDMPMQARQSGLSTARPARWMAGSEASALGEAAGGDHELVARLMRLLHMMLIDESKRGNLSQVVAQVEGLLASTPL